MPAHRIGGFGLVSPDASRLAAFYETAFDARLMSSAHATGARVARGADAGGALRHTLRLGRQALEILQMDLPGRPYPRPLSPIDTEFQHFALVVSDMERALDRLQRAPGWMPLSVGGPQRLPQRSGGVTAFKFQDPDGHPLELLEFPAHAIPPAWEGRQAREIFLGIDHSAISVRDTAISTAFYESLGFAVTARSFNHGMQQANLDGIQDPQVEVTALSLVEATPHLELLCYRSVVHPPWPQPADNDVAATRIVLVANGRDNHWAAADALIVDPDGHHLLLVTEGELC